MPKIHKHKSEQRSSSDETALRIKRERVLARLARYASTPVTKPTFQARLTHLLLEPGDPAQQLSHLALGSTIFDGIDGDPGRRLGQQVWGGAKERGAEIKKNAAERHQKWQRRADEIWARRPDLSISAVARIVAQGTDDQPNTIRLRIQRPKSKS